MLLIALPVTVGARTWQIRADGTGEAPTIQAGIDSAATNDSIIVEPGIYNENLDTHEKRLSLIGEQGAMQTVVDGGLRARVLTVSGGGLVMGLTFRRGQDSNGGGIKVTGPQGVMIRMNIIEDNLAGFFVDAGLGGGLWLDSFSKDVVVERNVIRNNIAGDSGGGVYDDGPFGPPNQIRDNLIQNNACHNNGAGVRGATILSNLIVGNWSDNGTAGVVVFGGEVSNNTIIGNHSGNSANDHGVGIGVMEAAYVHENIIALNGSTGARGAAIACGGGANPTIACNVMWGNDIDDIIGSPTCAGTLRDNFSLDPQFCAVDPVATLNIALQSDSPCAPGNHPGGAACGLIGAAVVGCGGVAVHVRTWSEMKRLFR